MATSVTCTRAASHVPPKYGLGVVTIAGSVGATISHSASHEFVLCKIPHGAYIIGGVLNGEMTDGAGEFNVGLKGGGLTTDDEDAVLASVSLSNSSHDFMAGGNLPLKISVTDNVRDQFTFLIANCGSNASSDSLVGTLQFEVRYTFSGESPSS